jgi:hypothetical protein
MSAAFGAVPVDELSAFAASRWHRGQLIAFSGVEGQTDYARGLVIRTTEDPSGLEIVRPDTARIVFDEAPETSSSPAISSRSARRMDRCVAAFWMRITF